MDYVKLRDGTRMPTIGLGTWQANDDEVENAVNIALQIGYRHFDTAYVYQNEAAIGRVLKKWLDSGNISRNELYITTKLPNFGNRPECVEKYCKKSLSALQLDYIDQYLVHMPVGLQEGKEGDMLPKDDDGALLLDKSTDLIAVWHAMEKLVDAGFVRSIGLSNFNSNQVKNIVKAARIQPVILQIELHLYFQQKELAAFCRALDIAICAYAPLGSTGLKNFIAMIGDDPSMIPTVNPLEDSVVLEIALRYGKTPAQILLRHIIQKGIIAIPKSSNPERIRQNFEVFDFELSQTEVDELDALDKGRRARLFGEHMLKGLSGHPHYPYNDPY